MKVRLNKYIASSGLGSRRKVEEFILQGRIKINGKVVKELSSEVDDEEDIVEFDHQKIEPKNEKFYLILNKPLGYITTLNDEKNRPIVMDLIPEKYSRYGVNPVGRLDKDTEGILLFTNDGELAKRLNHPKYKFPKEYIVDIDKPLENKEKSKIVRGIFIHQIKTKTGPAKIEILDKSKKRIKMTITEGKKRQIRYTFKNLGYKVEKLRRSAYGPLSLIGVNRGSFRVLKKQEVDKLKKIVGLI